MAEPENQTLRLLREIRSEARDFQTRVEGFEKKTDNNFASLTERLKSLQQAMIGESVLGRYTVAEVEERLDAIEKRLAALEKIR